MCLLFRAEDYYTFREKERSNIRKQLKKSYRSLILAIYSLSIIVCLITIGSKPQGLTYFLVKFSSPEFQINFFLAGEKLSFENIPDKLFWTKRD